MTNDLARSRAGGGGTIPELIAEWRLLARDVCDAFDGPDPHSADGYCRRCRFNARVHVFRRCADELEKLASGGAGAAGAARLPDLDALVTDLEEALAEPKPATRHICLSCGHDANLEVRLDRLTLSLIVKRLRTVQQGAAGAARLDSTPPCAGCGGPHPFDTTVPSVRWNAVIRKAGLPEYLCLTCIVAAFVRAGESFTADLTSGDGDLVFEPIEVRVRSQNAIDAQKISEENTTLRARIHKLEDRAAGAALAPLEGIVDRTVGAIGERFRTFGGGRDSDSNPLAHALRNEPLQFAASVDVRAVVEFVLRAARAGTLEPLEGESLSNEPCWTFTEHRGRSKGVVVLDAEQAEQVKAILRAARAGDPARRSETKNDEENQARGGTKG